MYVFCMYLSYKQKAFCLSDLPPPPLSPQVLLCITYTPTFQINGESILRIAEVQPAWGGECVRGVCGSVYEVSEGVCKRCLRESVRAV